MKLGKSLEDLAREVTRQSASKRDYVASTENVEMRVVRPQPLDDPDGRVPMLILGDDLGLGIRPLAHAQIAGHLSIPKPYYDRMLADAPALLADNVNTWFRRNPTRRMVRTLDGSARAFLSNGFRPLDNVDLLEATLPRIADLGVSVVSCEVTEHRLYLKVVDKRIERDMPLPMGTGHARFDTLSPALVISNSEVGSGALSVQSSVYTGGCTNFMMISERSVRKYHVGARADLGEEMYALLSDETRRITDEALWRQLGDVVSGAFDVAKFDAQVSRLQQTATNQITADPVKVVEVTARRFGLTEAERGSVLTHLIRGGSLTQYGLVNAVTRAAEDLDDYDRATAFEALGGRIVELPRAEWTQLAEARLAA